ncbi:MAG: LapA family protein [Sterolibacteriaceae bacterium MAG5]|nr:LapA family protein [Candidatus Nitricoxidireducens bremensis]
MQLGLIAGIVFAIVAALFAMQNIAPVTVTLGLWSFESSLALALLAALGMGALIAGLVSSPAMIRRQWNTARLGRQVAELERRLAEAERRNEELRAELAQARGGTPLPIAAVSADEKPYVGLRQLMAARGDDEQTPQR